MPPSNDEDSGSPEENTGGFQFGPHLESTNDQSRSTDNFSEIGKQQQERLHDLVRLEPTSNSELLNQWGLDSGSEVHSYLESHLKTYYYRDEDSYIRVTEEAKDFVRQNSGLYQDVTEQPDNSQSMEENIRNRDLLMDLVAVAQRLGHLPSEDEIEMHSDYSANRFRQEFGSLFEAFQEAGIVPDSVTEEDYNAVAEANDVEDKEAGAEEDKNPEPETKSSPSAPSKAELIEELQWLDEAIDGIPYPSDMNDEGAFTAHVYQDEFGSWDDALDAAGIDKEQELLKDMDRVAEKVGEDMTAPEMNDHGKYSSSMASRYFGSWTEAKERFQEWKSEKEDEEEEDSSEEFDDMVNDRLDDILG